MPWLRSAALVIGVMFFSIGQVEGGAAINKKPARQFACRAGKVGETAGVRPRLGAWRL